MLSFWVENKMKFDIETFLYILILYDNFSATSLSLSIYKQLFPPCFELLYDSVFRINDFL
jgi:hypothetical protein